jgi:hypothetical protein
MRNEPCHKRLPNFEPFDRIELVVTPRYKTSQLSGDEWRTSVAVIFSFKGVVVHETAVRDMEAALLMLGAEWIRRQEGFPDAVVELDKERCDQPGCPEFATTTVLLKRETASDGSWLADKETPWRMFRKFCTEHAGRGDSSREDCDENYEPAPAPEAEEATKGTTP